MKRLKLNFALAAIVLGATFGVATAGTYRTATLYFDCDLQTYKQIPPNHTVICDEDPTQPCTATGSEGSADPIEDGDYGCGTLVPNN